MSAAVAQPSHPPPQPVLPSTATRLPCSAADPSAQQPAPLSQFRLHPPAVKAEGAGGADADDGSSSLSQQRLAEVQAMLAAVQDEAAHIDATAGAVPAGGWGDLALPVVAAPASQLPPPVVQRSAGGRRAASPAPRPALPLPAPAQLLECSRCRKVLLACSAVQHHQQCSQQPEATVAGGAPAEVSSEARSSSDGAPPAAPSGSRGSKRKRLSGAAAAAAAKASRLSRGASQRAGSVEATPSLGARPACDPACQRLVACFAAGLAA